MNKFQKNLTSLEVVVILLLFTLSISIFSMNVTYLVTDEILLLSFFCRNARIELTDFYLKNHSEIS
ncbi:hypothetical protein G1K46_09305 [Tenacibaculum finnmarkense]|uniref:hypothetical protein n=1 Tax=Tenacibaculum finnmarkense TaxID=2781243 RepID=UPI001EFB53FA|nr:hypothetical protein [Tenacibaculum finnmarkense]MCG8762926.1 hypothetical protein [Tenacibaculum finnmarkense]MCG8788303.1 hypothetical protein [Tenacibaculum finnmarkense]